MTYTDDISPGEDQSMKAYSGVSNNPDAVGVLRDLFYTEDLIQNADLTLQGFTVQSSDDGKRMEWRRTSQPYLDNDTRNLFVGGLRMHINKVNQISDMKEQQLESILMDQHMLYSHYLFMHPKSICPGQNISEEQRWSKADYIIGIIMHQLWIGLYQANGGGTRKMLEKTSGYTEIKRGDESSKKGLFRRYV